MKCIFGRCLLAFLLLVILGTQSFAMKDKRVLLLNSYNIDLSWTASVTQGVEAGLAVQGPSVKLSVEFMDTKNYFNPAYIAMLVEEYRLKYSGIQFDAIITADDNAANFALEYRTLLFKDAPIIFCGVNNLEFPNQKDFVNITGVLEFTDIAGTIDAALQLQPHLKTFYIITDDTTTGRINRELVKGIIPNYKGRLEFVWLDNISMSELKNMLAYLPDSSAILFVLLNRDLLGDRFTFTESIAQIRSVANSPMYSMWDFYFGEGIVGGKIISGRLQGAIAAKMALEVISGKKPEDVPIVVHKANQYMFDYAVMERFGIDPERVPEGSILINVPESIYAKYVYEVWTIVIVITLLAGVIIILLANNRARRKAEHELEELNRYQESLIEQRTEELVLRSRELEMANYKLKKVDHLKTAVLNTVSHDLRTPLTSVLGFCRIIDRDFNRYFLPLCQMDKALYRRGDRIMSNLSIIEIEGERLTRLINDFLDLSKIESGEIAWNDVSVDPVELLRQARPVLEGYFADTGVRLSLTIRTELPRIIADPDRLLQLLNNLVGNAAKFTQKGTVELIADTTDGGWLRITVSDSGIGIPEEELTQIFDKFYQVTRSENTTEVHRGSGMGLAISKRIVEHYGGTIFAESVPGQGASFIFAIPSAEE